MARILVYPDAAALFESAANHVAVSIEQSVAGQGRCALALSGGSTPRELYRRLAAAPHCARIQWDRVHLFWGDERAVPPDHPDSGYRMAHEALISKVPVPPSNVHRMMGEAADLEAAAAEYERTLRDLFFPSHGLENQDTRQRSGVGAFLRFPRFPLILLGLGPDGHTASLFPGSPALAETERWVVATRVTTLNPQVRRLTLTLPVLNHAAQVIFLVTGASKAALLRAILSGEAANKYPAARVQPVGGELIWMLDAAAAGELGDLSGVEKGG